MDPFARQMYLETALLTATPQQLRLMLIHGAIKQAHAAREHLQQGRQEEWFDALLRCRDILAELLAGVERNGGPLTESVRQLYVFLLQRLSVAQRERGAAPLDEVLRVLDEERATWEQVCEQMPEAPIRPDSTQPQEILASSDVAIPPTIYGAGPQSTFAGPQSTFAGPSSFSFDA